MFRQSPRAFVLSLLLALSGIGCAAETEGEATASSEEAAVSAKTPAVEVTATWRRAVVGTPTYGYDATAPLLAIAIVVDDAALNRQHPGFDGFERPFALVPRDAGGGIRWDRVELGYRGQSLRGYYGERRVDLFEAGGLRLTEEDLALAKEHGIAVGLDTNRGTIWAQDAGKNFPIEAARPF